MLLFKKMLLLKPRIHHEFCDFCRDSVAIFSLFGGEKFTALHTMCIGLCVDVATQGC